MYGVPRKLTDIDIDIETSKDDPVFAEFLKLVELRITSPLEHFVDQNYDNYNVEITVGGIVIDICPMAEMNILDKETNKYVNFYKNGFPDIEVVEFLGFKLPLLSKELIIKNKEMLVGREHIDQPDIAGLKALNAK